MSRVHGDGCPWPTGAGGEIVVDGASDDTTLVELLTYGLWLPSADGELDWDALPDAYVRAASGAIRLGGACGCFVTYGQDAIASGAPLRVGLRAMDLAGNLGEPLEVAIPGATER